MTGGRPLPLRARAAEGWTARRRDSGDGMSAHALTHTAAPAPPLLPGEGGRPTPSRGPAVPLSPSAQQDDRASALLAALHDVLDPELPVSIVDLGLVYDLRAADGVLEIDLTFTATGCPCMDFIRDDIRERLAREPGVGEVRIREVWDPPWTPDRISPAGRARLRRHGVSA